MGQDHVHKLMPSCQPGACALAGGSEVPFGSIMRCIGGRVKSGQHACVRAIVLRVVSELDRAIACGSSKCAKIQTTSKAVALNNSFAPCAACPAP